MPYIAFLDLLGTKSSALSSSKEYTDAITDFNKALKQVSNIYPCKIYGYSDNAYIELQNLTDMINFFTSLRDTLLNKHRYFTAAVDQGSLNANIVKFGNNKGFSMEFTKPNTVDIYTKQCQLSGIGISLSDEIVEELKNKSLTNSFCLSIFQPNFTTDDVIVNPIYDLSYNSVILSKIEYIFADYIMTTATNERAGRYYITPIVSMIKSLNKDIFLNPEELSKLISLLSLQSIPPAFHTLPQIKKYSMFFMFSLLDSVLALRGYNDTIDIISICEKIICEYKIESSDILKELPLISTALISTSNKQHFLNILYNIEKTV